MAPDHNSPPAPSSHHTLSIPPPPSLTEETTTTCTSDDDVKTSKKTARVQRGQWLRAAVLGANDGLLSTASLMLGVTSASEDRSSIIIAGVAGTVSGAFSMALGEFVSVCTQRDIERDANKEATQHKPTVEEGAALDHEEEEEEEEVLPNPIKAALASGLSFMVGSVIPLLACMFVTQYEARIYTMVAVTTVALAGFGGGAAYLGGSRQVGLSGARVLVGGWLAMAITYWLLKLLDRDDPTKKFSLAG